jgi:hypothetical protein
MRRCRSQAVGTAQFAESLAVGGAPRLVHNVIAELASSRRDSTT